MGKIKVLIVEDHPVVINAIKNELDQNLYEVDDCKNIECAINLFHINRYNVLISDVRLSDGVNVFDLFNQVLSKLKTVHIIIFSSYVNIWLLLKLMKLGIEPDGIIEKSGLPDWNEVLKNVISGKNISSHRAIVSTNLVKNEIPIQSIIKLPNRQWELLHEFLKGKSDKEIANSLSISKHTVNGYRKSIYNIMEVRDFASLMNKFREFGYYDIESV